MPEAEFCSLWQPSVDFFSWQTYRQASIIISSNLVIMAGWCLENNLHKFWKPVRTHKIRAFGEHTAISGSWEWPRRMNHTIADCRRAVWNLSFFFLDFSFKLTDNIWASDIIFFLICSFTQALLSNCFRPLYFLLIYAGWWQWKKNLKSKIETPEMLSVVLRISEMHHPHCICRQRRKNDPRRDRLGNYWLALAFFWIMWNASEPSWNRVVPLICPAFMHGRLG